MSRRSYLWGCLTGLLLGVAVMWAIPSRNLRVQPEPAAPLVQVTPVAEPKVMLEVPSKRSLVPIPLEAQRIAPPDAKSKSGWRSFEFNGQTVYMIPLASDSSIVSRR